MAKQTINIGAAPNDGTGTPLRTSFDYCNLNFTELYTATGPSGNNIVVPGTATISGDLTVDTSTLKVASGSNQVGVGITTFTGTQSLQVLTGVRISDANPESLNCLNLAVTSTTSTIETRYGTPLIFGTNATECYRIAAGGTSTWSVGGSTAMTLNSTGLGVGVASPAQKLDVDGNIRMSGVSGGTRYLLLNADNTYTGSLTIQSGGGSSSFGAATILYGNSHATYPGGVWIGRSSGSTGPIMFGTGGITPTTVQMTLDSSGNVGVGTTPITSHIISAAGPLAITGTFAGTRTSYITNSSAASIYYTDGGGSGYFTDFGNLIIQPRTSAARSVVIATGSTTPVERAVVKSTGQVRFVPLAADPSGAEAGDVYYNSTSNKLKCYNGTTWNDLF
jgi:hypothetical protein